MKNPTRWSGGIDSPISPVSPDEDRPVPGVGMWVFNLGTRFMELGIRLALKADVKMIGVTIGPSPLLKSTEALRMPRGAFIVQTAQVSVMYQKLKEKMTSGGSDLTAPTPKT